MRVDFKILDQMHYYQRELYVLEIDGKVTFVYRGSGLNSGAVGRVLPFAYIKTSPPRGFSDMGIGWIAKEFFYKGAYTSHYKNLSGYEQEIQDFIKQLEDELPDPQPDESFDSEYIDNNFVRNISDRIKSVCGEDSEPFDWYNLVNPQKVIQLNIIMEDAREIKALVWKRASGMFSMNVSVKSLQLEDLGYTEEMKQQLFNELGKMGCIVEDGIILLK